MTSDVLQTMYLYVLHQDSESTGQIKVSLPGTVQTYKKKQFQFQTVSV